MRQHVGICRPLDRIITDIHKLFTDFTKSLKGQLGHKLWNIRHHIQYVLILHDRIFHQVHNVDGVIFVKELYKCVCKKVREIRLLKQIVFVVADHLFKLFDVSLRQVLTTSSIIQIPKVENDGELDLFGDADILSLVDEETDNLVKDQFDEVLTHAVVANFVQTVKQISHECV